MKKNAKRTDEVVEIDTRRVFSALWRKSWIIGLTAVVCAVLTFLGTLYFVTPQYQSTALFYVNNGSFSVGGSSISIDSGDLVASKSLVESYIVILNTRQTAEEIIDYAGVDRTYSEIQSMISAAAVNSTEIFQVVVTSEDPAEARAIAYAITQILPKRISGIIDGTSAKVVDSPRKATSPSSPSYIGNTAVGFLLGLLLSAVVIVLREVFDVTIRNEEDVEQSCDHPILAAVPDMLAQTKGGYYGNYGKYATRSAASGKEPAVVGSQISFAAAEAYKLLRTKLQFSFTDENDCHVIGVSSALAGEGKSLSSVNLACALAQLDKRVLLIDCDLRRPSLAAKLPIRKVPGLSNYLTRQVTMAEIIQHYTDEGGECAFDVISSGRNPPNPIELLSSGRMEKALAELRKSYDHIILDLPPVGEVSDALVAAKMADGILLVVRENYCNRNALSSAIEQFRFVEARVLGVVLNGTTESTNGYGKKYRGYRKYYHRYAGAYAAKDPKAKQE